jgi:hypothetical protein
MEMELNPRSLGNGLLIFRDWEHLKRLYMWKDSRRISSASVNFVTMTSVVQFSKKECNIFDSSGKWLMGGEMTIDNCYGLPGLTSEPHIICNKALVDDNELWHQRLGHLNFTNMLKIAIMEIVKDLPMIEKTGKGVCGPCQLGKQT